MEKFQGRGEEFLFNMKEKDTKRDCISFSRLLAPAPEGKYQREKRTDKRERQERKREGDPVCGRCGLEFIPVLSADGRSLGSYSYILKKLTKLLEDFYSANRA